MSTAVLLAQDTFNRSVSSGWGTADRGGDWAVSSPTAFAVTPGAGLISGIAAQQSASGYLGSVSSTNTDSTITVALAQDPSTSPTTFTLIGRKVTGSGGYRAKVEIRADGSVWLTPTATDANGVETTLTGVRRRRYRD